MKLKRKKWQCRVCGWIYDEALGVPDAGIPPDTPWEEVPDDWCCPDCGATKDEFAMVELPVHRLHISTPQTQDNVVEGQAANITLGAAIEGIHIDAVERVITFADGETQLYRSVTIETGSRTRRIDSRGDAVAEGKHVLKDQLDAPPAVLHAPRNLRERLAAWWWG